MRSPPTTYCVQSISAFSGCSVHTHEPHITFFMRCLGTSCLRMNLIVFVPFTRPPIFWLVSQTCLLPIGPIASCIADPVLVACSSGAYPFAHPKLPLLDGRRSPIAPPVFSSAAVAVCCVAVLPPLRAPTVK